MKNCISFCTAVIGAFFKEDYRNRILMPVILIGGVIIFQEIKKNFVSWSIFRATFIRLVISIIFYIPVVRIIAIVPRCVLTSCFTWCAGNDNQRTARFTIWTGDLLCIMYSFLKCKAYPRGV